MTDATGRPEPLDPPTAEVRIDASNLRGVAHPLRMRALGLLRRNGPATATQLAAQLGESSASLSYHLRQLETYGFVTDDERPAAGRERWWRAVHRSTTFDHAEATPEERTAGAEFLRVVGRVYGDRLHRFADRLDTLDDEVGADYARVATMSDWIVRLRPERALELQRELTRVVESYRDTPDTGDDVVPISTFVAMLPGRNS